MTKQEIQGEITACKSLLADTDYTILKTLEGVLACTSIQDFVDFAQSVTKELLSLKDKRQEWRDRINEMEAQLETMVADEGDDA